MTEPAFRRPDRALIARIFALAGPTMIEQALQTIVQYVDAAMVGRIGVQATAAVGLTTTVTWLCNSPLWAMGTGVLACVARASGARDERTTRLAAMQGMWLALIVGGLMTLITETVAPHLPGWMGAEEAIRADGYRYFAIICAPMVFRAMSFIMGSTLRASGNTHTPMFVNLGMNAINVTLNYLLIFPAHEVNLLGWRLTMPGADMGVTGAAIATAVSVVFSGSMMLAAVLRNRSLSPAGMPATWDGEVMGRCVRVGLPVALQNFGVFCGHVMFTAQVTSLGKTALATHTIALTAEEAIYIPGYGMQAAVSTLCGQAVGARDERRLDRVSRTTLAISMTLMTLSGAFLFTFPAFMMSVFTRDPEVIAGGAVILRIVACSEPLYSAMIIFEGVFHGVGQTRYPFIVSLCTMWGVRVLGTILCVRVLGLGLWSAWMCMVGDNVTRAVLLSIRYIRGRWKRSLPLEPAAD